MTSCILNCCEWLMTLAVNEDHEDKHVAKEEEDPSEGHAELQDSNSENDIQPLSIVRRQLFNLHGYNLALFPGGVVKGVREAYSPHAVLYIITVAMGEVIIKGFESGTYVAMDPEGRIYGEESRKDDRIRFMEHTMGNHLTYLNKKYAHRGWYLGLKKSGEPKKARLTSYPWPQKAILFTHRGSHPEDLPSLHLRNKHGFYLRVEDLIVSGSRNSDDKHTLFQILPGSEEGSFRLHALEDESYIAMSPSGRLYGDKEPSNPDTLFLQHSHEHFFEYLSHRWAHKGWYLAIKKNGKPKRGTKTIYPPHQNAIQFKHVAPSISWRK